MADSSARLRALRAHTVDPLGDGDIDRLIAGGQRRQRVRRNRRIALAGVAVAALVGGLVWRQLSPPPTLQFADGSTARVVASTSELAVTESSSARTVVAVKKGGARFEVKRNPERVFRVVAGGVTVEVVGTRFTVERGEAEVRVAVERGQVRVRSALGIRELGAGEAAFFPVEAAEPSPAPPEAADALDPSPPVVAPASVAPASRPSRPGRTAPKAAAPAAPSWREAAARRDYAAAYARLREAGGQVRDVPEELMAAADVARFGGHPDEAVPLLERVLKDHAGDSRAQLAAFTLGRVQLEQLHQPRVAAAAFARARALAPAGPLAEDALYREILCWTRAGDTAQARAQAARYLQLYPAGSHRRALERLGAPE